MLCIDDIHGSAVIRSQEFISFLVAQKEAVSNAKLRAFETAHFFIHYESYGITLQTEKISFLFRSIAEFSFVLSYEKRQIGKA